ncbi:hypothetical protein D8674_041590 [Pyrus ussuriensis x Pyrus communis]|uniref:SAM domain-containing protein n=1 Tax=Pyrus ussuriensis x Pyrus communis TaxID=2448454 RepID=A0A5N5F7E1_9ROSA|nr:hypothetical protein D8674_041590 [Pyrus ussuriensis x Pyrus communis]
MSNSRVTVTLGRSGQVVERGGFVSNSAKVRGDSGMVSGSKRMAGRLGSNAHGFSFSAGKRQRGDGIKWNEDDRTLQDSRISRNDLRLKLLQKRLSKKQIDGVVEERKQMDPHAKLSKPVHPSLRYQVLQHTSETNASSPMRQAPPRESPAGLYQVNSRGNFYSSPTTDGFRGRSPPRELHPPSSFRPVDACRAGQFPRNGMVGSSQPTDSFIFTMKAAPQAARPIAQFAPATGGVQRSSQMVDDTRTVAELLHRLGLGKYAIIFQAEEVDMTALKQMGDKDLKELGIPMGPRKKILLALLPRTKRPPP